MIEALEFFLHLDAYPIWHLIYEHNAQDFDVYPVCAWLVHHLLMITPILFKVKYSLDTVYIYMYMVCMYVYIYIYA